MQMNVLRTKIRQIMSADVTCSFKLSVFRSFSDAVKGNAYSRNFFLVKG